MIKEITLIEIMEGRANTYALLSRLFGTEVDDACLSDLRAMRYPQGSGNDDVDAGYRLMHSYISGAWERTIEDLARDWARTFIGSNTTSHSAAYPNESVYTSAEHLMMQQARDEVMALYHAEGLMNGESWPNGEDHVAVECEFMSRLARRGTEALAAGDEDRALRCIRAQEGFLDVHLAQWAPLFCEEVQKFSQTDFYRGLALLLRGFCAQDLAFLQELTADEQ